MADTHSKEIRSMNMSHIRSTNSKPEGIVRKYLFSRGLRYRKNVRKLPGTPDIVLKKYKTAIFGIIMTVAVLYGRLLAKNIGIKKLTVMWKETWKVIGFLLSRGGRSLRYGSVS